MAGTRKAAAESTKTTKSGKDSSDRPAEGAKAEGADSASRHDGVRETMESIVVAFILAFLFRTFEAEAFVIPTGSMAPTLYGRHKVVDCDRCGYQFAIGASDEVDEYGYLKEPVDLFRIFTGICPNCRNEVDRETVMRLPPFKGDRILVNKFPYEFSDPERWDVGVFKYPEEPKTNYIKRIVGLPGETLVIRQGDVYRLREEGDARSLEILRKEDPYKQREIGILVYDNDFPERGLRKLGWPSRWAAVERDNEPGSIAGWSESDGGWEAQPEENAFRLSVDNASGGKYRWLRYRHIVPRPEDWEAIEEGRPRSDPRPQLIADFCGYNASTGGGRGHATEFGTYWVGDLALFCQVDVEEVRPEGRLLFELNEGFRKYRCRIDPSTGRAVLFYPDPHDPEEEVEVVLAEAETKMNGPGSYTVSFANVDDRLCLWINGGLVRFGSPTDYPPYGSGVFALQQPTEADLIPVGVAAQNLGVRVSHLRLERDIYYRSEYLSRDAEYRGDDDGSFREYTGSELELHHALENPAEWWDLFTTYRQSPDVNGESFAAAFELGPEEYFVLGDNSPRSRDSRLWPNQRGAVHRHAVPRSALVGKAFFIYWPHGVPFLNNGRGYPDSGDSVLNNGLLKKWFYHRKVEHNARNGRVYLEQSDYPSFRVPFYPNIPRMRRIR